MASCLDLFFNVSGVGPGHDKECGCGWRGKAAQSPIYRSPQLWMI